MTIKITRTEETAADLRREAGRARTPAAARRMLAIALVLEGVSRRDAARQCGMDRQTLRDWVHRFNAAGPEGLYDRRRTGPLRRLTSEQEAALEQIVRDGTLLLQLHHRDAHEHPYLIDEKTAVGNGVVLWFQTDRFDEAVERVRKIGAEILEEPHVNPLAQHRECLILDPDGYKVAFASPYGDLGEGDLGEGGAA